MPYLKRLNQIFYLSAAYFFIYCSAKILLISGGKVIQLFLDMTVNICYACNELQIQY